MPLSKAALNDLLKQVPEYDESELPTLEDKKEFVANQLTGTQKMAWRALVEVEVAKEFASSKKEEYQENARTKLEQSTAELKAYKPTIAVLSRVAKELEA